jgi:hypothetical protein
MIFYVTCRYGGDKNNIEKAKEITRILQKEDMANCYVNPLIFLSHLDFDSFDKDDLMELRLDVLQNCDKLIVVGDMSASVKTEVDFAKLVKMEVMRIDEFGELQPFAR